MKRHHRGPWLLLCCLGLWISGAHAQSQALNLRGYTDASGAITVQHLGDTVDPYFALQALGMAQTHGLDISSYALPWARWVVQRYQEAGHIGRYCQSLQHKAPTWRWCKPPDADDSTLALWLQFLHRLPNSVRAQLPIDALQARATQDLRRLHDPDTGLYHVSPHIRYSLFMDNLEVWSAWPSSSFALAIQSKFWDPKLQIYRVSTQAAHPHPGKHFYPDATAQIFPLLVDFPHVPGGAGSHYTRWMQMHRSQWLAQSGREFPWGLIALVAWRQGDMSSVRCWQQRALPHRHSALWTITDEVVAQILPSPPTLMPHPQENCT